MDMTKGQERELAESRITAPDFSAAVEPRASITSFSAVKWEQFPDHFHGALSKVLVRPETTGSRFFDHRISSYAPRAYVGVHSHKVQEQIYHLLSGEGVIELDGVPTVVRAQDVIFVPPGCKHSIHNTGLDALTFLVITSPPDDR
jgi:mannose-6-phosphate isomerase-like protein (cupin superfamily)